MARRKQNSLPMEIPGRIEELHAAALNYVAIRDERMDLTEKETAAKEVVRSMMEKHNETTYNVEGVEITLIPGETTVKVKVHKAKED